MGIYNAYSRHRYNNNPSLSVYRVQSMVVTMIIHPVPMVESCYDHPNLTGTSVLRRGLHHGEAMIKSHMEIFLPNRLKDSWRTCSETSQKAGRE